MCGRFTLRTPAGVIVARFGLRELAPLAERYNIAPTQEVLAVRRERDTQAREAVWLYWGLVPSWAKELKIGAQMINARSETIAEKPAFRAAFKQRRCLIVADGFYEWQAVGRKKQPYHIRRRDGEPFAFAGLWEYWRGADPPLESCTIVTTEANAALRPLHARMPVILEARDYEAWLDPATPTDELGQLCLSRDHDDLEQLAVSTHVNNARSDDPGCLAPRHELFP